MKSRLLPLLVITFLLMGIIGWAEVTSWREVARMERRLNSVELRLLLAHGEQWVATDRETLHGLVGEARVSLGGFRAWLIASCAGVIALAAVIAFIVRREMIAPLEQQLDESHANLVRHEKLASLGLLAAGVAHEIRNPLTAIKARLFSQKKKLTTGSPEHADADFINDEIDRLEGIVKDFLEFARPAEPTLRPVAVAEFLNEVRELMFPVLRERRIDLRLDPPGEFLLAMDRAQIKQVLINLIGNAADSIRGSGAVTLRVHPTFLPFTPIRLPAIAIEVEDTGSGIVPEVEKRLFDPFFTTKETGTGLGLAIAERIVERHEGVLQFRTQLERGTIFSVILPVSNHDKNVSQDSAH